MAGVYSCEIRPDTYFAFKVFDKLLVEVAHLERIQLGIVLVLAVPNTDEIVQKCPGKLSLWVLNDGSEPTVEEINPSV